VPTNPLLWHLSKHLDVKTDVLNLLNDVLTLIKKQICLQWLLGGPSRGLLTGLTSGSTAATTPRGY